MARLSSISTAKWAQEYNKTIKCSMCDLIYDVITCCVWSCDTGKINEFDKIVFEDQKKRENMEMNEIFT